MAITPETRIGDFLAAHPDQQEPLLDQFRQEGTPCWREAEGTGRFRTWILKP